MIEDVYTVRFQFALGKRVKVKALDLEGLVISRCERQGGTRTYNVLWWAESRRFDEWLHEEELEGFDNG